MTTISRPQPRIIPLRERPAWKALQEHHAKIQNLHLRQLFAEDPQRGERFALEAVGLYFDYSKNRITDETIRLLLDLAAQSGLREQIDAMFSGEKINVTEKRAVLHVALRTMKDDSIIVDGVNVVPEVHAVLDQMTAFANHVRSGAWKGHTGKRIRNVINIGIGGSDLGPVMAYEALKHYSQRDMTFRFVSNVDGTDFAEATRDLNADETLFIVSSKTFTTLETMTNAHTAREWVLKALGDEKAIARHFVAVSTNTAEVEKFGIDTANMFGFWDWVGGRYSMDSAIGLSTMIAIGPDHFREMLAGFHAMDEHFRTAPFDRNLPVLMGLLAVWYNNFFDVSNDRSPAVRAIPQALPGLPAAVDHGEQRKARDAATARPWIIRQDRSSGASRGPTASIPSISSFIKGRSSSRATSSASADALNPLGNHHDLLMSNVFAQAEALAFGKTPEEVRAEGTPEWLVPHRTFEGNRPSNVILAERLTPETLGKLVALYEHSVFTQGTIWQIDSFDQWGVELGKVLAERIIPELESSRGAIAEAR